MPPQGAERKGFMRRSLMVLATVATLIGLAAAPTAADIPSTLEREGMMSGSQARTRNRMGVLLITMMLIAMLGVAPTSAITNGTEDGEDHPNVGAIVLQIPDVGVIQGCSGTLLEGGWFLTASHCLAPIEGALDKYPGSWFSVTFDEFITEDGTFYNVSSYKIHPEFGKPGRNDTHDVGLIKLDRVPSISPAVLPTAGQLDELKAQHALKDTTFTAVGYGAVRETQQGAFASILPNVDGSRDRADQGFHSLTGAWLNLPMTPATGDGGTCYGDSGGPHFIWLDDEETNIVASITVTGDITCKALDKTYRMDTAATLAFLDGIMNP